MSEEDSPTVSPTVEPTESPTLSPTPESEDSDLQLFVALLVPVGILLAIAFGMYFYGKRQEELREKRENDYGTRNPAFINTHNNSTMMSPSYLEYLKKNPMKASIFRPSSDYIDRKKAKKEAKAKENSVLPVDSSPASSAELM